MSGDLVKVCLLGPAKLGTRWLKAGDEPEVSAEDKSALILAGVVAPDEIDPAAADQTEVLVYTEADFHAKFSQITDDFDAVTEGLKAELEVATARYQNAEEQRAQALARQAELEAIIAAGANTKPSPDGQSGEETTGTNTAQPQSGAAPADQNTPPTETAAKTAQKKGAAANTKA